MTDLSAFLTQREQVHWTMSRTAQGKVTLRASHPKTLAQQTWVFPQDSCSDPRIVAGHGSVRTQDGMIFVAAGDGRDLTVEFNARRAAPKAATVEARR